MRLNLQWRFVLLLATVACFGILTGPALGQHDEPDPATARIRSLYGVLLVTMKQADQLGIQGRYDKLGPAIRAAFDLAAMTRIAVGPEWNSISPEQQAALIESFSRMTIATYASRFDGYSGERFDVEPVSEARTSGRIVRTQLVPSSGDPVTLNYLVRQSADNWKIVDVYLAGTVSELATRRSEFVSILKSGGPDALIESLRQQSARLLRAPGPKSNTGNP